MVKKTKKDQATQMVVWGLILILSSWAANWIAGQMFIASGYSWMTVGLLSTIGTIAAIAGVIGIVLCVIGLVKLLNK